ncbi:endonuclease domain-containing protein [Streptomyces sp. NPDC002262]|uniref:endonuclease domain-containing protein n=1 Tax=Streptomyces sp. NPDC002262 TaxID=3154414 RepID=UPI00331C32AC
MFSPEDIEQIMTRIEREGDGEFCGCGAWAARLVRGRECQGCYRMRRGIERYGLTIPQYNAIWRAQGFRCALCGDNEEPCDGGIPHTEPRPWQIDHDHHCCGRKGSSNRCCVRGILCLPCNLHELAPYERKRRRGAGFPVPVIDAYLADPPARRAEARVIRGRDDAYLPTSWAFIHDAQVVKQGYVGWV